MYGLLLLHSIETIRPCISDQWQEEEEQSDCYTTTVYHWRQILKLTFAYVSTYSTTRWGRWREKIDRKEAGNFKEL